MLGRMRAVIAAIGLMAVACGGNAGAPPGTGCSTLLDTAACEGNFGCHLCVIATGDGGMPDGGAVGRCRRPCKLAAPDCPAGQACIDPQTDAAGSIGLDCGQFGTYGYCR
jgi:hypothetical protein